MKLVKNSLPQQLASAGILSMPSRTPKTATIWTTEAQELPTHDLPSIQELNTEIFYADVLAAPTYRTASFFVPLQRFPLDFSCHLKGAEI